MEENKVATDSELRERARLLVNRLPLPRMCPLNECADLIFRELVAVRDQAAKYMTAEEWKRMHAEITK